MPLYLYFTLRSIILSLGIIILVILVSIYKRHRAKIEKLAIFLQLSILTGFIVSFINLMIPSLIIFQITIIIGLATNILFIYVFFTLLEGSGESRPKWERLVLMIYSVIVVIFMVIFAFYEVTTVPLDGGIMSYGLELHLVIIPAILMLLPYIYMIIITGRFFQKLYDKEMRKKLNLFYVLLLNYLSFVYAFLFLVDIRVIAAGALIVIEIGIILFLKLNHNFLAQLHSTFAYKRVFIIRNNGQTIYSHDFSKAKSKEVKTVKYLIGGFIYAITHGIKEIVKQEYEAILRSMDFGNLKMLFFYGEHVFGVLFSREANNVIYNRLERFVRGFEGSFPEIINDPTGTIVLDDQESIAKDPKAKKEIESLLSLYFKF